MSESKAPVVHSTATPDVELLLQMRAILSRAQELRDLFVQFRAENKSVEWLRDTFAMGVLPLISGEYAYRELLACCQFLADEYAQLGTDYLVVSTTTGRAVAVLSEDDLYNPGVMARHLGVTGTALKRIKPSTEVMLVMYEHEQGREREVLQLLQNRYGISRRDHRLSMATREGRASIARDLEKSDPRELLRRTGGTLGRFLQHFQLVDHVPLNGCVKLEGTATHLAIYSTTDPLTLNLGFSRLTNLRSVVPCGWIRDLCKALSAYVYQRWTLPVEASALQKEDLQGPELWIADPDARAEMLRVDKTVTVAPVEGVLPVGLTGHMGYLVTAPEFTVHASEKFDRWEVTSSLPFELYLLNPSNLRPLSLIGVPRAAELS